MNATLIALSLLLAGLYPLQTGLTAPEVSRFIGLAFKQTQEPPDRGAPEGRNPFGTRGPCEQTDRPFTPLLPLPTPTFSGKTLADHPTFWFYIPYDPERVESGQFVIRDQTGDVFYGTLFELPATPGFVQISLPSTHTALTPNHAYRWELTLYCATEENQPDSEDLVRHTGQITHLSNSDLAAQLTLIPLEERLSFYRDHQLWYDAATELEEITPHSVAWNQLFSLLELEELEGEAIAGSVIIPPDE